MAVKGTELCKFYFTINWVLRALDKLYFLKKSLPKSNIVQATILQELDFCIYRY